MADKHLYEFGEVGFYAAESQESAFTKYDADCGEPGLAAQDFKRAVPDDEIIEVCGESPDDKWDDPREYQQALTRGGVPDPKHVYWFLKVTAHEWANELSHGDGHVFGGDA